jgi:GntR family transcriptional regulator, vanillate catabolism transcriptional regulator
MSKSETDAHTRFEAVLLRMRGLILSGELEPGSRLQEATLAARLGVSRTPVRLSLSVLEKEGLVRGAPNRGFMVRTFTIEEVMAAYDVRAVLEGFACRLVAELGLQPAHGHALGECLGEGDRLLAVGYFDASTIRSWSNMNGRFHSTIIEASGNTCLAEAILAANQHPLAAPSSIIFRTSNLARLFECMRQAQREHAVIVDSLQRRTASRAEALMVEHVYQSREILRKEICEKGPGLPEFFRQLPNVGSSVLPYPQPQEPTLAQPYERP